MVVLFLENLKVFILVQFVIKKVASKIVIIKYIKIMSKKTFKLVTAIIGAVQAVGVAVVPYVETVYATAIN